ncbi:esterase/lipase family protein [Kitasatospora aburaviensis]
MANKASIVFAHGLWADGSCFNKLIPALQAEGHEVYSSQHGLDSLEGDVACVTRAINHVPGPVVLVGHSYGGTLITKAGVHDRVGALVYIAALGPDEDETSQDQQNKFPACRSSTTSTSPTAASGSWSRASATSAAICRRPSRSSFSQRAPCPSPTCSTSRFPVPPGARRRVGTSSRTTTAP